MANPVTDKQTLMIKKVQLLLNEKFEGSSKQEAYLWLRDRVPLAENRYDELTKIPLAKLRGVQSASQYMSPSSYESKMKRLFEIDYSLNHHPNDLEGLENIIRELNYFLY